MNTLKIIATLASLVFVFSLFPQSAAAVVWEDDFNDGNYDGWTVTGGEWSATNGYLEAVLDLDINHDIRHNSSQVVGTWSFDVFLGDPDDDRTIWIDFVRNSTLPPDLRVDGYHLRIKGSGITLGVDDTFPLGFVALEDYSQTWTHIDITRNSTGGIHLYVNATSDTDEPALTAVNTKYSQCEIFHITHRNEGSRFDNFSIDNEVLFTRAVTTTDPTTTTTTTASGNGTPVTLDLMMLALGGGAVVVLVIVIVIFKKR